MKKKPTMRFRLLLPAWKRVAGRIDLRKARVNAWDRVRLLELDGDVAAAWLQPA